MNFLLNLFNFRKKKELICPAPFSQVYIYHDGRVFLCPDCYTSPEAQIGNLNEQSFDDIWNSPKAVEIRQNAKNMIYKYCNPRACFVKSNFNVRIIPNQDIDYSVKQRKYPQMVCIGPDWECNASCIMCRPCLSRLTDEQLENFNKKINEWYIPILKNAKELTLSTTSDPFASRNTRLLMKTAANTYPNLKFNLLTNGILCDRFNCEETGILKRINKIMFSIHASNKTTYEKVVKNGNYERMTENLKWMSSLKQNGEIKGLYLAFVISTKNFEDIPNFCEFARQNNAVALFWMCRDWGGNLGNADEPLEVWNKEHAKFRDLQRVLRKMPVLETPYSHFNPYLQDIRDHDI